MKIKWSYKFFYEIKYKITYIQRNQVASFSQQNTTKNTTGRATFLTSLVKSNQPVSEQMEQWNWLKCVAISYTENIACNDNLLASILFLKVSMSFPFLMVSGTMSQTFASMYLTDLNQKFSEFTFDRVKSIWDLKLQLTGLGWKIPFIIVTKRLFLILKKFNSKRLNIAMVDFKRFI